MLFFCSANDIFIGVQYKCFGVHYKFFGVLEKKFERAVQTIAASLLPTGVSFFRLLVQVLMPYVKFLKHSTKVCCILLGRGCKSLSMDSLLLSKTSHLYLPYLGKKQDQIRVPVGPFYS